MTALPMAHIFLMSEKDSLVTNTDMEGFFSLQLSPSPRVQLIVSYVGYDTQYKYLEISSDVSLNVVMTSSTVQLNDVVVVARSKAMVGNTEQGEINLNSKKLDKIPSVLGVPDMIKILQLMPGVQNSGEANGYLYVRGADPGHNLMLYNDVPVYGMSQLLGIFPFYNADHTDRIHFDKSGRKTQYSNRLSATIQAITPDQLPDSLSVKGNIGLVASQATIGIPIGKKAALMLSGRQTYIDQIITPLLNKSADKEKEKDMDNLGYSFSDANLTFLIKPNDKHHIDINAFTSNDRFSITEERMLLDGKLKWNNHIASATWSWTPRPKLEFKQSVYLSAYTNKLQVEQASINLMVQSKVMDWGFNSSVGFLLKKIPFTAGLQYANYLVRPQEISSGQLSNTANTDNKTSARHISAFIQGKPRLSEYMYLDIGIRAGLYAYGKSDFRLEPSISLIYSDDHRLNAYLSYSRKNQYLHLITTSSVGIPTDFWIATSEGVPTEVADNFSVGAGYKIRPRMELTAGAFYNRLLHLVQYPFSIMQFNEITSFGNDLFTGKGKAYGVELMLKKTGRFSGWISYTLSKSDRQFDEIDHGKRFPSKFDRRHNLSLVANYEISPKWSAGFTQIYASGNRFTAPVSWYFINNNPVKEYGSYNNAQMPDYVRTDISVDFFIRKTARRESILNLSVYNIFAVDNPIYVILDISASSTRNEIEIKSRYKRLYSILPSVGWRFKF